ncbi:MAG: hypothetical protein M1834_005170 [Cirrosporium novae-zelandiae]|nr:MAG: hypothetical protein M1834_005170 [Cirrosporium novae-zelandiae]
MSSSEVSNVTPTGTKRPFSDDHKQLNIADLTNREHNKQLSAARSQSNIDQCRRSLSTTSDLSELSSRQTSPALSGPSSLHGDPSHSNNLTGPPAKKQKLTFAEREAEKELRRIEKEQKQRQREEDKARKEAEKRLKDVEKQKRDQEREEKKRLRDAERHQKEEEKRRKEEEKNKKDRSQLRLNSFFKTPAKGSGSPAKTLSTPQTSEIISDKSFTSSQISVSQPSFSPEKQKQTDYEKYFPSFFIQSHTILAPWNRFERDREGSLYVQERLDSSIGQPPNDGSPGKTSIYELLHILPRRRKRPGCRSVKDLMILQGSTDRPIDLTNLEQPKHKTPIQLLKNIPMKHIEFSQDVRPPYNGTFSKKVSDKTVQKLSKNPFQKALSDINYDYDSEAEWEEPGEGEDLESEPDEDAMSDEGDEDMEGFLDDEEEGSAVGKRRLVPGDLEPWCSGLLWEDARGAHPHRSSNTLPGFHLDSYQLEVILENPHPPIDPFSTIYWESSDAGTTSANPIYESGNSMQPPRMPMHSISGTNTTFNSLQHSISAPLNKLCSTTLAGATTLLGGPQLVNRPPKAPKRMVPLDMLPAFKNAVQGSDLTKAGLVEVLKKVFPKLPKDVIKDSLGVVAERVGGKEADKRWVLIESKDT